jgi:hypothetical protein
MKKILFSLSVIGFAFMANAQVAQEVAIPKGIPANEPTNIPLGSAFGKAYKKTRGFGNFGVVVGNTFYDLQTNASMSRRIINYPNGSVSAIWTTSAVTDPQNGSFADRGTGYNHLPVGGPWPAASALRVETTTRTGFCNLLTAGTKEYIVNHNASAYSSFVYDNPVIGSRTFGQFAVLQAVSNTDTIIWPKSASSGSHFYVIGTNSNTADATTQMYYSYSPDAGVTWPKKCIALPGIVKNQLWGSSADSYNIDARDSFVSIIIGTLTSNLYCIRSSDYGNTWVTDTVTDNGQIYGVNNIEQTTHLSPTDSIAIGSDGSASVYIDYSGVTHVIYSPIGWSLDTAGAAANILSPATASYSVYFNRFITSLSYWTPGIQTGFSIRVDSLQDCNDDATFTFGANNYKASTASTPSKSARYGSSASTNFSQMASIKGPVATGDTLVVVYSAVMDADTTEAGTQLGGQNFRDIFVKVSFNGGGNWNNRVNVSNSPGVEDVFPSIAKLIDGSIHLLWQSDLEPGTVLTNGDDQGDGNNILYLNMTKSYLYQHALDGSLVCQDPAFGPTPSGIDKLTDKNGNPLFTLTPNPATTQVTISGAIADNTITVTNALGQLMNVTIAKISETKAVANVQNLAAGVYYVQIANAKNKTTTRFVKN